MREALFKTDTVRNHVKPLDGESSRVMRWNHLKNYLNGVGKRVWFLHHIDKSNQPFDSSKLKKGLYSNKLISDSAESNLIVSLYEGVISEHKLDGSL